jgi:preprotein translocase subunit SecD
MLEFPRWKHVLIALVLLVSLFYALPNIYPQDPAVQVAANRGAVVNDELVAKVRGLLDGQKVPYKSVAIEGKHLVVRLTETDLQARAADTVRPALGSDFTVAQSLASNVPSWYGALGAKPMTLGLDLQGGVHFLMEVDQAAAREKREAGYVNEMQEILRTADIDYKGVTRDAQGFRIDLVRVEDRDKARRVLLAKLPGFSYTDGADGSLRGVISPELLNTIGADAIDQNITTLRNRVASLAEPVIQRQGDKQIVVELPGIQDVAEAKKLIGGTATLEWRAVLGNEIDWNAARDSGVMLPGSRLYYQRERDAAGRPKPVLLSNRIIVAGEHLLDARPEQDPETKQPAVSIRLDSAGGNRMAKHTIDNVNKPMAIVYINLTPETKLVDGKEVHSVRTDQEVISIATIRGPFGANFQTTGLEPEEARDLSKQLKAGALAAPMEFVEERVVGPSLGKQNVENGIKAVLYSFVFVMVFFLVYYKMFGIITNLALLLNLLLVVALMSLFGATLTLPGFAGIALTVGMSVDANVLINERIREELRLGLSPLASIAAGYDRASGTIADANVTALLGGMAMAAFGTGPIRGFGITLIIGILTSMFTAVTVSRGIATLVYGRRRKLTTLSI